VKIKILNIKNNIVFIIYKLLNSQQKKSLIFLFILVGFSILFEMLGIGILLPAIGVILNKNIAVTYPSVLPILKFIGNPNQVKLIAITMVLIAIIFILKSFFLIYLSWVQSKFGSTLTYELNNKLFKGYLNQDYFFHLNNNSAILLRNIQNIGQFTAVTQALINLSVEISLVVSIFAFMVFIEPLGSISVAIFLLIFVGLFQSFTRKKLLKWGYLKQKYSGEANMYLLQGLGGVRDIKIYGKENYFSNQFSKVNKELTNLMVKYGITNLLPRIYLELISILGLVTLVLIMLFQDNDPARLIGVIGVFSIAAYRLIPSMNRIMSSTQVFKNSKASIDLIFSEILEIEKIVEKNDKFNHEINFNNSISFENVSFSYPSSNKSVLNNISIDFKKGDYVGIVGGSGAGKSTMIDLLIGLYNPTNGCIKIDNINLLDCKKSWQNKIGYVPQNIYLFDDTILNNIAFGIPTDEINLEKLRTALIEAELFDFVESLPDGLNTKIGERGSRLSGGQKQRIGIARALYNNPSIIIFDEATNSLDKLTEKKIIESIDKLKGVRTIISITHNTSTIAKCDKIYQIKDGCLFEKNYTT
jgi:ABC-type multidrug transport system fused ATPase/permease subunit